jgi:hypothetical protein
MDDPTNQPNVFVVQHEAKRHYSVQATRLIHEHYGDIMAFMYSRAPLRQLVQDKFLGEWKYLHLALFELPEERATRALIELGMYIRLIDDDEDRLLSKLRAGLTYGYVVRKDGSRVDLAYREVSNKIIHALRYEWLNAPGDDDPSVVCIPSDDEGNRHHWTSARINLVALGSICGAFMS